MLPYRGEPSQFLQGLWSDGNSVHRVRMSELGHEHAFAAGSTKVCSWVFFRQTRLRADAPEPH